VDLLLDERGNCAGFLMPRLDVTQAVLLRDVYHPGERRRAFPQCSWKDLVHICANLASVVAVVHQTERYVVGDLNESNILVVRDSKLVTFVDCDSIQARGDEGEIMLCPVGKSEYLAPELQGKPLTVVARNKSHDAFSLAVMIFLMLMQGVHPFDGTWADDTTSRREDKITRGAWPYDPNNILRCQPRPNTLPLSFLPPNIVQLTQRCFLQGLRHPELRPSAKEWHRELLAAEQRLRQCPTNRAHYYGKHLSECPWCQQTKIKGEDPFPGTAGNLFASFSLRRLWPGSGQR
jgi:DNA-binding helix-hairpin-helix protein with protein kinase domain